MTSNGQTVHALACDWNDSKSAILAGPAVVAAIATAKTALDACAPQGSAAKLQWSSVTSKPVLVKGEDEGIGACIAEAATPVVAITKGTCTAIVLVGDPKRAGLMAAPLHD